MLSQPQKLWILFGEARAVKDIAVKETGNKTRKDKILERKNYKNRVQREGPWHYTDECSMPATGQNIFP